MTRASLISLVSCLVAINQAGLINRCDLAKVPPQEGMHGFEGCSLRDYKEFIEELFRKVLRGQQKDTSAKLTAEPKRASSSKKGDSWSASLSLLTKLLSEQQEVQVSKEEQDTNQWKNESYKPKRREAKGEREAQESSELTKELPEYGYNGTLTVAMPVIVGAVIFIVIFCFIAIYCRRTSSKEGKEGSSRGFFSILRHERCSPEHTIKEDVSSRRQPLWLRDLYRPRSATCIEDLAQKLRDKDTSVEDELFYQM
ncbi:leucine-rich repeat-containing protein 37A [Desmodus rotundus]|uniref:leucine-rich repeat-containing protein 37A n=1 Tax=Desmodus rotundus TaxID=9430 RepID=UPI0023812D3D|nr:leucine-rich repeat-containing protein 37A [Desmodus rotundus]